MNPTDRISALAARLLEARGADLLRFLRQRLGSEADARDIAQETYLRLIRLGDPERIDNPEAYLFRIATNLLWERKLKEQSLAEHAPLEETPTAECTPYDLAISTQTEQRIHAALAALPSLQRTILVLHLRDELTCGEIGRQTGLSASMVRKHLNQALILSRKHLRDLTP